MRKSLWHWLWSQRLFRFAVVGGTCLLLQVVVFKIIRLFGTPSLLADPVAFLIAAQCNYWLSSRLTWADSTLRPGERRFMRWCRFMGVVILAAVINTLAFDAASQFVKPVLSVVIAGCISAVSTFLINNYFVFRSFPRRNRQNVYG